MSTAHLVASIAETAERLDALDSERCLLQETCDGLERGERDVRLRLDAAVEQSEAIARKVADKTERLREIVAEIDAIGRDLEALRSECEAKERGARRLAADVRAREAEVGARRRQAAAMDGALRTARESLLRITHKLELAELVRTAPRG